MIYKQVSSIKEPISAIGIGCWNFGGGWDSSCEKNSVSMVHAALDAGINLFDVAPVYGYGVSETILGKALQGRRDKAIIATKAGIKWDDSKNTRFDLSKDSILSEIEDTLTRLGTDYVDIYQMHWPDPSTPLSETAEALSQLRKSGKIRYVGLSNFSQADVEALMGMVGVECQQSLYNMLERNPTSYHEIPLVYRTEDEVLPNAEKWGQAFLPYSPLFQGLLAGKFTDGIDFSRKDVRSSNPKLVGPEFRRYLAAANEIHKIANELGRPMEQLALNWLRQKSGVTSIISGASSPAQVGTNAGSCEWDISEADMARLDAIVEPFKYA
ncbi:MAG: aldo/keto reductase [Defluviitaleaceae bacterium]|nr:aldo/keto reductase [Defluviitaleaceae bacterium]